ncbi:hypothetical protein J4403_01130 [Candidatus Woesearchaeota archaeon]|nr:hypothetical protein [Candidatus Woesearchaeota archaeon]
MNISKRNKQNILSAWKKRHGVDEIYIQRNQNKYFGLKSRICGFMMGEGNILINNGKKCKHNTLRFFPDHYSLVLSFNEDLLKVLQ